MYRVLNKGLLGFIAKRYGSTQNVKILTLFYGTGKKKSGLGHPLRMVKIFPTKDPGRSPPPTWFIRAGRRQ